MFQKISMADLHEKFKQLAPKELILDVRTPEEYSDGHIPGSKNIPYDEIENHVEELKKVDRIYLHCAAGKRATIAAQVLIQKGIKNLFCVSSGGMGDWESAGFPVKKGN